LRHTVHLDAREGEFASPDPEDSGGERDAEHAWLVLQSERRAVELRDGVNFQDWLGTRPGRRTVELRLLCLRLYLLLGVCDPGPRLLVVGRQLDPATDGPQFALLPDQDFCSNSMVAPASSCTLQIAYVPSAAGAAAATLSIPSSDPAQPNVTVALSGTGTTATAPTEPASTTPAPPGRPSFSAGSLTLGGHRHISVGFTLTSASTVVVTVQRRVKGRFEKVGVRRLKRAGGPQSFVLGQRFDGHALTAGQYRIVLQTEVDGTLSTPVRRIITVKPATHG
jgi:hypothetical protein